MKMNANIFGAAAAIALAASFVAGCQTASQPERRVKVVAIAESCATNRYIMSGKNASDAMAAAGYLPVSLGNSRLRTETAGVVACHTAILLNEKE